jgi:hypothetical protein
LDPSCEQFDSKALPTTPPGVEGKVAGIRVEFLNPRNGNQEPVEGTLTYLGLTPPDTTPPTVTSVTADPNVLWPPNGKRVDVTVTATATDEDSGVASAVLFIDDEYGECDGQVAMTPAGDGVFTATVQLPARRAGKDKDGRSYILTVSATDGVGNVSVREDSPAAIVLVPHDQGKEKK